jgi:hypothetical protein
VCDRSGLTANVVSPGIILTERIHERMTETALQDGRSINWSAIEEHMLTAELE